MTKKVVSRKELLSRWSAIQEEEEQNEDDSPSKLRLLHQHKEQWFADTFNFLINQPEENHIWCGSCDLMGPLLETFYNYLKDERTDSPLRLLWMRISNETRQCIQCISQHHQAQETYKMDYELSCIGPLLDVLRTLDEERVTQHLRDINARLKRDEYDPLRDNAEVVSLMYEVLMFPVLLDDRWLLSEFESFIEAVDNKHELALAGQQQFSGVYALLFFNRRVRTVGRRLARSMEKLRRATDLEPLQPLLNKFIGFLETEILPSTSSTSRPRAQVDRLSIWLGITSLLEFLEPPAFEEGILEHYPIFFDIVLNHISGDSAEFSHAVSCLKELFKMLGCKLWLRSTLSPSVMRNTLLGQCFHTRNEKIHKDIFDLFLPFLQSLEALGDGEHEKQRRHFLYFLLHQVPVSSNFNTLTRKLACKIALLIVYRGYKMNPPCPPFDCVHMWGPSLVSSLKDSSLHSSLRQPAFDLIQTIIVSDASALVTSLLSDHKHLGIHESNSAELNADADDRLLYTPDAEGNDNSCWSEFVAQNKITSHEYRGWMTIPMLWIDVLVDIDPAVLPGSFCKAVFWARSHLTMVEPETSAEMSLAIRAWLSSSAKELSASFGWKIPIGVDDGGDGKDPKNSVRVSMMLFPLIRTFNRLTAHFIVQMGHGELWKQWTWEPRMAESLILSLVDPNDNVRQFGKCILEQVSNTRGLTCGLKFLCSCISSMSAMFLGWKHAAKVVRLDSVILKFQTLQHFFFVLCKILKEGGQPNSEISETSSDIANIKKYSSHGGFLKQSVSDPPSGKSEGNSSDVDFKSLENFCYLLSEIAWSTILKCLGEGKGFIDCHVYQMTCVRVLEIIPVVFERLCPSFTKHSGSSGKMVKSASDFLWLHDLMDWGKSSLKVIIVYWKRTVSSLLNLLKGYISNASGSTIRAIENLISSDSFDADQLTERVSSLRVSLAKEVIGDGGIATLKPKALVSEGLSFVKRFSAPHVQPISLEDEDMQILDPLPKNTEEKNNFIVLSDDESEKQISRRPIGSKIKVRESLLDANIPAAPADKESLQNDTAENVSGEVISLNQFDSFKQKGNLDRSAFVSHKQTDFDKLKDEPPASIKLKRGDDKVKEKPIASINVSSSSQHVSDLKNYFDDSLNSKSMDQTSKNVVSQRKESLLKEIISDANVDPLEPTANSTGAKQSFLLKLSAFVPKRQVIQLKTPAENRFGNLRRQEGGVKRFKPPKLDEWYRPILEINYFAIVGLTSGNEDKNQNVSKLKEVPVFFQSPEQYLNIFRPLVLEEFKAQLHSSFLEVSSLEDMYYGTLSVLSVERVDDFHLIRFVHDEDDSSSYRSFGENDLVLLTKEAPQKTSKDVHMVGKVERRERDGKRRSTMLLVRFYLLNGCPRLTQARRQLTERTKWHASRIMSITPQLREFQALSAIKDIPVLSVILKPVTDSFCHNESREPVMNQLSQPLQQILKSSFNDSQLKAISVATGMPDPKKDFELSLIQGPPGTGKTRTILAIVSGLLASLRRTNDLRNTLNGHSSQSNSRPKISQSVAIARAWQDAALARQLNDDDIRHTKSAESSLKRRVLLCAQSNAAVDELVSRISNEGLYGSDGKMYKPYLVRVGNAKTVHPNSLPFFIDTLVDHRLLEERVNSCDAKNDSHSSVVLRANLEKIVDSIRYYETKRANLKDSKSSDAEKFLEEETQKGGDVSKNSDSELEVNLRKLYEQKKQLYKDLSVAQAQERKNNQETRAMKDKLRKSILKEAEIVVTTLSGCGGDLYGVCAETMSSCKFGSPSEHTLFDAVVIDEAAQALEPATLIPLHLLKSHGTKCIMVGDPKQLPATVLSNVASKFLYECSMFERLQKAGHPVTMLTKQYRMHPEICRFPSLHFYDNKLLNGENMSSKSAAFHETGGLGPYIFYDIVDGQELRGKNSGAMSLYNEREAEAAVELLRFFKKRYPSEFSLGRIGVITPYKCQLSLLRSRFSSAFGSSVVADIEFNTVDGFQGREVDILILSTVRAADSGSSGSNSSSIGFVADVRRMNVALTRAKVSLWILGNARTLQTNRNWASLVKDAKERNLVISIKRPYESFFRKGLRDNCTPANSDNHSRRLNSVNNVAETCRLGKQNEPRLQKVSTKNMEHLDSVSKCDKKFLGDVDEQEVRRSKRREREPHEIPSAEAGSGNRKSRNADSVVSLDKKCERKHDDVSEKKPDSGDSYTGKRKDKCSSPKSCKDSSGPEVSDGHKYSKANMKGSKKSSERDKSQRNLEGIDSLTKDGQKVNDASNGGAPKSKDSSADLITKRKQQREAVDAILFSSLIPSKNKKSDSTRSLPSKRPLSSTSTVGGGGIRPPKAKKGS